MTGPLAKYVKAQMTSGGKDASLQRAGAREIFKA
jgi:hypothetical protein